MINLMSAAPSRADSSVVDAAAVSGGSPMGGGGGSPGEPVSAEGQPAGGKRLFGALLASAFGSSPRSSIAGGRGNGLPVPPLEEREVGAGIRLITAEGAERPSEDALFAFAVSQGLDASLVASVLWPGMAVPGDSGGLIGQSSADAGASVDALAGFADAGEAGVPASGEISGEMIAALLAGILPGRPLGVGPIGAGSWEAGRATGDVSPGDPSADLLQEMAALGRPGVGAGSELGYGALPGPGAAGADITGVGSLVSGANMDLVNAGGQPGGFAAAQAAMGVASLSDSSARGADVFGASTSVTGASPSVTGASPSVTGASPSVTGASPSVTGASPLNFGSMPALGSDSTKALLADPQWSAAVARLTEARAQVRLMGEGAVGLPAFAGGASGISLSSVPAQWVLMGAVGGASASPRNGALADPDNGGSVAELTDSSLVSDSEGTALHGLDAGHRHSAGRSTATATDPIDLSGEAARGASSTDPDAENGLAKRLAEGVAQRMLAAVSSNNWKLQIDLKPAHLGHISVEMSMQQGQLEAVFDAGQASARQLISEGFDRLRQDLQRAGMNVAHLGLNFGAGAGTGGKPTPRGREAQAEQEGLGAVQSATMATTGSRTRAGDDGLDVMV